MRASLLISWAFPVVVVAYLIMLARFVSSIRNEFRDYWQSIGNPNLWDPNGQLAILRRIFWPKLFPREIVDRYSLKINVVRILGVAGLVFFVVILLLIWQGGFEG